MLRGVRRPWRIKSLMAGYKPLPFQAGQVDLDRMVIGATTAIATIICTYLPSIAPKRLGENYRMPGTVAEGFKPRCNGPVS